MQSNSSIQRIVRDIVDLCELQVQLLSIDSQAAKRKLGKAIVCGIIAASLAASALTVLMAGGGLLIGELTSLSAGGGLLVVGFVASVIVSILLAIAVFAVRSASAAMSETKSEFSENLRWLKATLITPDSSTRNQIRRETFPERGMPSARSDRGEHFDPHPVSSVYER